MLKRTVIKKATARTAAAEKPPQGRRFDAAQKQHALVLVASGMGRRQVAATIGTTTESLRRWVKEAAAKGTVPSAPIAQRAAAPPAPQAVAAPPPPAGSKSPYAPADPAQGLSDIEVA